MRLAQVVGFDKFAASSGRRLSPDHDLTYFERESDCSLMESSQSPEKKSLKYVCKNVVFYVFDC